ncbi:MAG: S-methyl-5-thioribose-1-phosphate isomerase [Dehalococcoidales bacterium]|nr:S-methyl-5-thioribose-1-phosphate isomerase [Dehalococcoidales bacterium]
MQPIEWLGNRVKLLDQTRLPQEEVYLELSDYQAVASAIRELKIRGAPAIGVAAAYGIALGALEIRTSDREAFRRRLNEIIRTIAATRPTARNLFMAIEQMEQAASLDENTEQLKGALIYQAINIHSTEIEATRRLAEFGAELLKDNATILTHCNTGSLATTGSGTALGVIKQLAQQNKKITVLVDETRPLLQGTRLTAWELSRANIPFKLITDSMAGYFMSQGRVNSVIVGADRIAANGDTANKIGTYTLSVLAMENGIPFYVAAPVSTIDLALSSGKEIPIEERNPAEVTHLQGISIAPEGTLALNPAFDVTPHHYITAFITEKGIIKEPYIERLKKITG